MLESIKDIASELIPSHYIENLSSVTNENQLLETLVYEISLGINKENANTSISILTRIFKYKPILKSILEKTTSQHFYNSPGFDIVYKHFKINYKERTVDSLDRLILEDNEDALVLLDLSSSIKLQRCYRKAIEYENIVFLKYLLLNYQERPDIYALNVAIYTGNLQIYRILMQTGSDFSTVDIDVFKNSHHYDLMSFMECSTKGFNISEETLNCRSLYFTFVYNERFTERSIDFDLSCINDRYSTENNLQNLIKNNCMNIITNNDFHFNYNNLALVIALDNSFLFEFILARMKITNEYLEGCDINILQAAVLTENVEYVKKIHSKNNRLILDLDRFGNNILHFIMRQDNEEVSKFIISQLKKSDFLKLFQSENFMHETPMFLCKKYEHSDLINELSDDSFLK